MYKLTLALIVLLTVLVIIARFFVPLGIQENGFFNYKTKEVIGYVVSDPEVREKSQKFLFQPEEIITDLASDYKNILIFADRYLELSYGDKIKLKGEIRTPEVFNDFDYPAFLARKDIFYVSSFPSIELLPNTKPTTAKMMFWSTVFDIKNKLRSKVVNFLPEHNASLVLAATLGDSFSLSSELNDNLIKSGLRHIVAVSGLHMSIILGVFFIFFIVIGLKRNYATITALTLLVCYVVLTGMPFSVIRASIMGIILFLGFALGRPTHTLNALILSAIAIVLWKPLSWQEVSFQLSFGAVLGIILFLPLMNSLLTRINFIKLKIPTEFSKIVKDILAVSLSVLILTWPILALTFNEFSIIAPISNILVLPFLPVLMVLGFAVMTSGLIFAPLAIFFSWFLWLVSEWVIIIAGFFGNLPLTTVKLEDNSLWFVIGYYLLLGFLWFILSNNRKLDCSEF